MFLAFSIFCKRFFTSMVQTCFPLSSRRSNQDCSSGRSRGSSRSWKSTHSGDTGMSWRSVCSCNTCSSRIATLTRRTCNVSPVSAVITLTYSITKLLEQGTCRRQVWTSCAASGKLPSVSGTDSKLGHQKRRG